MADGVGSAEYEAKGMAYLRETDAAYFAREYGAAAGAARPPAGG